METMADTSSKTDSSESEPDFLISFKANSWSPFRWDALARKRRTSGVLLSSIESMSRISSPSSGLPFTILDAALLIFTDGETSVIDGPVARALSPPSEPTNSTSVSSSHPIDDNLFLFRLFLASLSGNKESCSTRAATSSGSAMM